MVSSEIEFGPALDVNLLSTPTPRKLFALWFEAAGRCVAVLPSVLDELAPLLRIGSDGPKPLAEPVAKPLADRPAVRHQLEWVRKLRDVHQSIYRFAPLTPEQSLLAGGCRMPNVADRLLSRLKVDRNLRQLAAAARKMAAHSQTAACERERVLRAEPA